MMKALKDKATALSNKFAGNTDFLEAVCAASALIAAADGTIEDSEVEATLKAVKANALLAANFDSRQIEQCASKMLDRAEGGRVGRMGLYDELADISKDPQMAEAVVLAALDVAEADGDIGEDEMKVLKKIGTQLGVNVDALLDV